MKKLICATVSLCSLGGCWVPKAIGDVMQQDIRELKTQTTDIERSIEKNKAKLEEQTVRAQNKIDEVDTKLQDLNRAARKTDAGMGVRMDELQRELQELRGQNELYAHQISEMEKQFVTIEALTTRLDNMENSLPKNAPVETPAPKKSSEKLPTDRKGLLAHGKGLLKKKEFSETRGVLRGVLKKWPKEAGIADDASFHIGESYFREKKYRAALQEYIQVVESFPKSPFTDDAYYRIGLCAVELGNFEDALIFFNEILTQHKRSPLVKSARQQIKKVKKRLGKEKKGRK